LTYSLILFSHNTIVFVILLVADVVVVLTSTP